MFWTRDTALLARVIQNSKYFVHTRNQCDKVTKVVRQKQRIKDETDLFGKLIETNSQKQKRIKRESKEVSKEAKTSNVNSEFAWILQTAKTKPKVIKKKKEEPVNKTKDDEEEDPDTNYHYRNDVTEQLNYYRKLYRSVINKQIDTEETVSSESKEDNKKPFLDSETKSVTDAEHNEIDIINANEVECTSFFDAPKEDDKKQKPRKSKKSVLLENRELKIWEYPLYDSDKSSNDKWNTKCKLMSLSPMDDKDTLSYPSVTKILSATMTEEAKVRLERWKQNMIEKMGLQRFELYQAELLSNGKLFHSIIMNKITEKPYEIPDQIKDSLDSLEGVIFDVTKVRAIESQVIHPKLKYRGIMDCVADYRGDMCVIDWKKSDKPKDHLAAMYDAPLQLASYIGALNADLKYPYQIKKGLLIVAYTNGEPAKVHEISEEMLERYWKLWLNRLQVYHNIKSASS